MPPTLVNVAVGVLVGVALLGAAFDRRSLAIVAVAAALPDFDAVLGLLIPGATNALLHTVFIPAGAAALLYWDTKLRDESWLRSRYGWYGIRVGWVAIASYAVAGIGLDLFNVEAVALLYPISETYFAIVGRFVLSTQEGVIQTYVEFGDGWLEVATRSSPGVDPWVNPSDGDRKIRIVDSGWQVVVVVTAIAAAPAKAIVERGDS